MLLVTEAAWRNDVLGLSAQDSRVLDGSLQSLAPHTRVVFTLLESIVRDPGRDTAMTAFVVDWLSAFGFTGFPNSLHRTYFDDHRFSAGGRHALWRGRVREYFAGPVFDGPSVGFVGWTGGPIDASSSHGQFTVSARQALASFDRALAAEPALTEARVRKGRLLYLLDRRREAEATLAQALVDATRDKDAANGYLSGLFLGQLFEDAGRFKDAVQAYRESVAFLPDAVTATLALGRALIQAGQSLEGWNVIRDASRRTRADADPWYAYGYNKIPWNLEGRVRALRQAVQR